MKRSVTKRLGRTTTALLAAIGASSVALPAAAQAPAVLDNKQIEIVYVEPSNANNRQIYEALRKRRVLEELKAFLAPLRLPADQTLTVKITDVDQCQGLPNAWFSPSERTVSICYQYIDWYRRLAPRDPTPERMRAQDAIVGPFLEVLFHELGHAVFYLYKVPLFGREEDAADQIAAYLLTQFGEDVARRTLLGAAYFYDKTGKVPDKNSVRRHAQHGLAALLHQSLHRLRRPARYLQGPGREGDAAAGPRQRMRARVQADRPCVSETHRSAYRSEAAERSSGQGMAQARRRELRHRPLLIRGDAQIVTCQIVTWVPTSTTRPVGIWK